MASSVWFSWDDLMDAAVGGTWLLPPSDASVAGVSAVEDDSRAVGAGALFVAIPGELTDGHRFVANAARSGVAAVCVSETPDAQVRALLQETATACLRVGDTLALFQALARRHRLKFPALPVVAVTGSSGKTSTKEMIAAVLEAEWPGAVLKTEGNTNNHFGVPRNLLRITARHRAAVIELGTNHPGEIAALAALVETSVGVVCNVGSAHMGLLGGRRGIAEEKSSLFRFLPEHGTAIYPAGSRHDAVLSAAARGCRTLTFGDRPDADVAVHYEGRREAAFRSRVMWNTDGTTKTLDWPYCGAHQALNAGAALAVGAALGMTPGRAVSGLLRCQLPRMRMEITECDGVSWVNDAYNANPDSMRVSLRCFDELATPGDAGQCYCVLGDMLELGEYAETEHDELLDWALRELPQARLLAVGPLMTRAAAAHGLPCFQDAGEAREFMSGAVAAGDWVLLKGSRSVGLERVLPGYSG